LIKANGKTYELIGDTAQLAERIGHKVRLWGHAGSSMSGEKIPAGEPRASFGVEKVESLSATCK
jgi:hypothetical protein